MLIDREELQSECRRLIRGGGGLLVAVGDNSSGRNEAARIAASLFENSGLNTHHVLDAGNRPSSFRYILENIGGWAVDKIGTTGSSLSLEASNASVSLERMSSYCVQVLASIRSQSTSNLAFVISALGQNGPVDRRDVELMGRLILSAGGCWVVVTQDGASWRNLSTRDIRLRDFTRTEVADAIRRILQARGDDLSLTPRYLGQIFESGRARVAPIKAYYHLQQLATTR